MNRTYKGSVESLRDYWERRSESFESEYNALNRMEGIKRIVNETAELIDGKLVLDIGCGPGILATLYPRDSSVVGLDFSVSMLRSAENRIRRVVLGDTLNLPFRNETFGVVTCFFVASDYSQKEHIFSDILRVLEDKALLLFADYSPGDTHWKLRRRIRPAIGESCDIYIEDQRTLSKKLRLAGFRVQEAKVFRFNAGFDLRRYVRTEKELQLLKETEPRLFTHIQELTERKRIVREFILLVARRQRAFSSRVHQTE